MNINATTKLKDSQTHLSFYTESYFHGKPQYHFKYEVSTVLQHFNECMNCFSLMCNHYLGKKKKKLYFMLDQLSKLQG